MVIRNLYFTQTYLNKKVWEEKSELCKGKFTQRFGNLKFSEKIFFETVRKIVNSDQVICSGRFYRNRGFVVMFIGVKLA